MALLQVNYISNSLMRTVTLNVILPVDKTAIPGLPSPKIPEKFKTLYLLHGIFGNYTDWVSGTSIQRWAEEKNLAVVMPSGENCFYLDQEKLHHNYGEFIGRELPEMTRKMFPLSEKRKDTFIAGLSMGGYGALRNGLKYNETFSRIAALSSALLIDSLDSRADGPGPFFEGRAYAEAVFGDFAQAKESDKNPKWLIEKLLDEKRDIPQIYLCCGNSDFLLDVNKDFYNFLKAHNVPVTFETGDGSHEWDFWNRYIKRVLDWLPLDGEQAGVSSGNIGKL